MGAIGIILLVAFVIVCVLLVLVVLVQDDGSSGMGGLLGGRGTAAFGSHSASVLTRTTAVLVFLFFALSVSLALLNKKPKLARDLAPVETSADGTSNAASQSGNWWKSAEPAPAADAAAADGSAEGTAPADSAVPADTAAGTGTTTSGGGQN